MKYQKTKAFAVDKSKVGKPGSKREAKKANKNKPVKKSYLNISTSQIACKARRLMVLDRQVHEKRKLKKKERK